MVSPDCISNLNRLPLNVVTFTVTVTADDAAGGANQPACTTQISAIPYTHYGSRTIQCIHIPTDDEAADEAAEAETAGGAAEPTDASPSSSSSIVIRRLRFRGAADREADASGDVFAN